MRISETVNQQGSEFSTVEVEIDRGDRSEEFLDWFHEWTTAPGTRSKFRIDLKFGEIQTSAVLMSPADIRAFLTGWRFRDALERG